MTHGAPAVIEVRVSTLREGATDVMADIWMDSRSAAKHGVCGAMKTALRPWLGEKLLSKGIIVYMHYAGRVELATRATLLEELAEADAVDVVLQTESLLPATSSRRAGQRSQNEDSEQEPMFAGFKSLGDGEFYT